MSTLTRSDSTPNLKPPASPTRTASFPFHRIVQQLFSSPPAAGHNDGDSGNGKGRKRKNTFLGGNDTGGVGQSPSRARSYTTASSSSLAPSAVWSKSHHKQSSSITSTSPSSVSSTAHERLVMPKEIAAPTPAVTGGGRGNTATGILDPRFAFPAVGGMNRTGQGSNTGGKRVDTSGGTSYVASLGLAPLVDNQGHAVPLYAPLGPNPFASILRSSPPRSTSPFNPRFDHRPSLPILSLFDPPPLNTAPPTPTPSPTPPVHTQISSHSSRLQPKMRDSRSSVSVPDLRSLAKSHAVNSSHDTLNKVLHPHLLFHPPNQQELPQSHSRSTHLVGLGVSSGSQTQDLFTPTHRFETGGSTHIPVSICEAYTFPRPRLAPHSPNTSPVVGSEVDSREERSTLPVRFADFDGSSVRRVLRENDQSRREREEWAARGRKRSKSASKAKREGRTRSRSRSQSESGFESDNSIGISWSRRTGVRVWARRQREAHTQTDDEGDDSDTEERLRTPPQSQYSPSVPHSFDPFGSIVNRVRSLSLSRTRSYSESRIPGDITTSAITSATRTVGRKRSASDAAALKKAFAPVLFSASSQPWSSTIPLSTRPSVVRMRSASLDSLYIRNPVSTRRVYGVVEGEKQREVGKAMVHLPSLASLGDGIRRVDVPLTTNKSREEAERDSEALRYIPSRPPPPVPDFQPFASTSSSSPSRSRLALDTSGSRSLTAASISSPSPFWDHGPISAQSPVPPFRLRKRPSVPSPSERSAQYEADAEKAWRVAMTEVVAPTRQSEEFPDLSSPTSSAPISSPDSVESSGSGVSTGEGSGSRKSRGGSSAGNASMLNLDEETSFKDLFFRPPPPSRFNSERFSSITVESQSATVIQEEHSPPETPVSSSPNEFPFDPPSTSSGVPEGSYPILSPPTMSLFDFPRPVSDATFAGSSSSLYSTRTEELDALFNYTLERAHSFLRSEDQSGDTEHQESPSWIERPATSAAVWTRPSSAHTETYLTADEGGSIADESHRVTPEGDEQEKDYHGYSFSEPVLVVVDPQLADDQSPTSTPSPPVSRSPSPASTDVGGEIQTPQADDTFGTLRPFPTPSQGTWAATSFGKEFFGKDDHDGKDSPPGDRPSFLDFTTSVDSSPALVSAPLSPPLSSGLHSAGSGSGSFIEFDGDERLQNESHNQGGRVANSSVGSFLEWTPPSSPTARYSIPFVHSPVPDIPQHQLLTPPTVSHPSHEYAATGRDSYLSVDSYGLAYTTNPPVPSSSDGGRTSYGSFGGASHTSLLDVFPAPPEEAEEEAEIDQEESEGDPEQVAGGEKHDREHTLLAAPSMSTIRRTRSLSKLPMASQASLSPSTSGTSDWTVESTQPDEEEEEEGVRRWPSLEPDAEMEPRKSRTGSGESFLDFSEDIEVVGMTRAASSSSASSTKRWSGATFLTFFSPSRTSEEGGRRGSRSRSRSQNRGHRHERTSSDPTTYVPRGGWEGGDERRR